MKNLKDLKISCSPLRIPGIGGKLAISNSCGVQSQYALDKSIRIVPTKPPLSSSFCQDWSNLTSACCVL